MNEIVLTVCGNVTAEPVHRRTDQGLDIVTFRVASNERRKVAGQWLDGEATYITVTCFRALAENAAGSVRKGQPVIVHGKLRVRKWQTDERSGTSVEMEAWALGHDLARGTAQFQRVVRTVPVAPERAEADELVDGAEAAVGEEPTGDRADAA